MKDIRLRRLLLENFKGCRQLELTPMGRNLSVYGDNATGKTTIYDGLTWLLFGKDSRGQSSFEIKPLGPDGAVLDHGAITAAEAVFQVLDDGETWEVTFKRTYYEKWSAKRGRAQATFDGNTSDFFVDGVPVKKYAFEEAVDQLADEDLFRLLTDVTHFSARMDWKGRRETLFAMCGVESDGEILGMNPDFAPLLTACGDRLTVEDLKKKLLAERKGLSGTRNHIPVRLDECQKTLDGLQGLDFNVLRKELDQRVARRSALEGELLKLDHNTLLESKRNERAAVQNQLDKLENENLAHRCQGIQPTDRRPALETAMEQHKKQLLALAARAGQEKELTDSYQEKVEQCREQWKSENAKVFTDATCPTCGQVLPPSSLAVAREGFEQERRRRQALIVEDSDRYKAQIAAAEDRRESFIGAAVALEGEIAKLAAELAALPPEVKTAVTDLPDYRPRREAFVAQLAALDGELARLSRESQAVRQETRESLGILEEEIAAIQGSLSQEAILEATGKRMEALRQEAQTVAQRLDELDRLLERCEDFARYKVRFIEDRINGEFQLVRFRLFTELVNGGLADCCEVTVEGVPYASLNSGARINAGMDIIRTLSQYHGTRVPLFVDNGESVTTLLPLEAQVIRLVVSEADKQLRLQNED